MNLLILIKNKPPSHINVIVIQTKYKYLFEAINWSVIIVILYKINIDPNTFFIPKLSNEYPQTNLTTPIYNTILFIF